MAKKNVKSAKSSAKKKKVSKTAPLQGGAEAFVDHLENNAQMKARLRKGWSEVIAQGKKKGFKFSRQELREHLIKRYGVTNLPKDDEPDTCICI